MLTLFSVYVLASLALSSPFGIPGLIYANILNMSIRITSSLFYAFQLEGQPMAVAR